MSNYDSIGPVELATMSFGHGLTVTPIQLITAVSAIANKGIMMQPRWLRDQDSGRETGGKNRTSPGKAGSI